jgi:hypothetical protein
MNKMALLIQQVKTWEDHEELLSLRYQVFQAQNPRFRADFFPVNRVSDALDKSGSTVNFIAYQDAVPVGFIRITRSLVECSFPHSRGMVDPALTQRQTAMIDMFGAKHFGQGVRSHLIEEAIRYLHTQGIPNVLCRVSEKTCHLFRAMGFNQAEPVNFDPKLGAKMVVMSANVNELKADPGTDPLHYHHFGRLILNTGESLFEAGSPADISYLIVQGKLELSKHDEKTGECIKEFLEAGNLIGAGSNIRNYSAMAPRDCAVLILAGKSPFSALDVQAVFDATLSTQSPELELPKPLDSSDLLQPLYATIDE